MPALQFLIGDESHSSASQVRGPPTPSDQRNVASYHQDQLSAAPTPRLLWVGCVTGYQRRSLAAMVYVGDRQWLRIATAPSSHPAQCAKRGSSQPTLSNGLASETGPQAFGLGPALRPLWTRRTEEEEEVRVCACVCGSAPFSGLTCLSSQLL